MKHPVTAELTMFSTVVILMLGLYLCEFKQTCGRNFLYLAVVVLLVGTLITILGRRK